MVKLYLNFIFFLLLLSFFSSSFHLVGSEIHKSVWPGCGSDDLGFDPTKVIQVSRHPRIYMYKGFLTHEECDHLIALARDQLQTTVVVEGSSGKNVPSEIRTSTGTFLQKHQDEIVTRVEMRISLWTFLPEDNAESIQVLRYEKGQKYDAHHDYFYDKYNQEVGGNRITTVLMYLSDVEKGGETVFPSAVDKDLQKKDDSWSDCARDGFAAVSTPVFIVCLLAVTPAIVVCLLVAAAAAFFGLTKPKKGDTVLFFDCHPNTRPDPNSLHKSCPVIEGEKWAATKWIRMRPYLKPPVVERSPSETCFDDNDNCPRWAEEGECENDAVYMVGTEEKFGKCRKSCRVC